MVGVLNDFGTPLRVLVYSIFFWSLIGFYAFNEAKREERTSPKLRAVGWPVFGLIGVIHSFKDATVVDDGKLKWLAFAMLLFAFWLVGTVGQGEPGAWYPWVGFYAGLFVMYVMFDPEAVRSLHRQN